MHNWRWEVYYLGNAKNSDHSGFLKLRQGEDSKTCLWLHWWAKQRPPEDVLVPETCGHVT